MAGVVMVRVTIFKENLQQLAYELGIEICGTVHE
jgi:hypothetical protein